MTGKDLHISDQQMNLMMACLGLGLSKEGQLMKCTGRLMLRHRAHTSLIKRLRRSIGIGRGKCRHMRSNLRKRGVNMVMLSPKWGSRLRAILVRERRGALLGIHNQFGGSLLLSQRRMKKNGVVWSSQIMFKIRLISNQDNRGLLKLETPMQLWVEVGRCWNWVTMYPQRVLSRALCRVPSSHHTGHPEGLPWYHLTQVSVQTRITYTTSLDH